MRAEGESTVPMPTIDELTLADEPERWRALGFTVHAQECRLGSVRVRLAGEGAGKGIVEWSLRGLRSADMDGLPTRLSERALPAGEPREHPNGVLALDHVVVFSPALDRTVAALQTAGIDLRRVREEPTPAGAPRQAFFRLGEVILEVVQAPPDAVERGGGADRSAQLWGLAMVAEDLPRTVDFLGENVGEMRAAVQPGRMIATLRRSAGLAVPVALMSREPSRVG